MIHTAQGKRPGGCTKWLKASGLGMVIDSWNSSRSLWQFGDVARHEQDSATGKDGCWDLHEAYQRKGIGVLSSCKILTWNHDQPTSLTLRIPPRDQAGWERVDTWWYTSDWQSFDFLLLVIVGCFRTGGVLGGDSWVLLWEGQLLVVLMAYTQIALLVAVRTSQDTWEPRIATLYAGTAPKKSVHCRKRGPGWESSFQGDPVKNRSFWSWWPIPPATQPAQLHSWWYGKTLHSTTSNSSKDTMSDTMKSSLHPACIHLAMARRWTMDDSWVMQVTLIFLIESGWSWRLVLVNLLLLATLASHRD